MARRIESNWRWTYESRAHKLLPFPLFLRRAAAHVVLSLVAVTAVDAAGTVGYHFLARLPWVDAFLNASMILSAMGPVDHVNGTAAKIFSALYALFSGVLFIVLIGIVLAPWAHRLMHRIHMDFDEPGATTPGDREAK